MPKEAPLNRLGLAEWVVDRKNPLTARVEVNRLWATLWGIGLVKTEGDFGTQGERPIYKELLDWMAVDFMDQGWSMKKMLKLIVMSNTYKQSSAISAAMEERDPENRLLARGARFRMSAEMVRDNALVAANLLSSKIGGPSVMPDQPDGVWNVSYNDSKWVTSPGEDRYRRGLYTFWRRTEPYPAFLAFDGDEPRGLHRQQNSHEHAVAGAGAAQRPGLRVGRPGNRRKDVDDQGRRSGPA